MVDRCLRREERQLVDRSEFSLEEGTRARLSHRDTSICGGSASDYVGVLSV